MQPGKCLAPRCRVRYDFDVDIISLVVQIVTAVAALTLAFIGLRISAKPGIRVYIKRNGDWVVKPDGDWVLQRDGGPVVFAPGEVGDLSIYVELRGFFYGKPTASDLKLTVNVQEAWDFKWLSWTAPGPFKSTQVGHGKGLKSPPWWAFRHRRQPSTGPSKYLVADRLWLTRDEWGEALTANLGAPSKPGDYIMWVHGLAREGDCGVHVFELQVRNK